MPPNQYDELERAAVLDEDEDGQEQARPADRKRLKRAGTERMRRVSAPFVRVLVSWFTTDPRARGIHSRERLLLLLLHLSRWGLRPVALTSAATKQIGITRQERLRLLGELEELGWIQVTRDGRKALVVCPLIAAPDPASGLT
jgi:hypothetical protein